MSPLTTNKKCLLPPSIGLRLKPSKLKLHNSGQYNLVKLHQQSLPNINHGRNYSDFIRRPNVHNTNPEPPQKEKTKKFIKVFNKYMKAPGGNKKKTKKMGRKGQVFNE